MSDYPININNDYRNNVSLLREQKLVFDSHSPSPTRGDFSREVVSLIDDYGMGTPYMRGLPHWTLFKISCQTKMLERRIPLKFPCIPLF